MGFSSTVSERAFIARAPSLRDLAQTGTRPHRAVSNRRPDASPSGPRPVTIRTFWVGATFQLGRRSSPKTCSTPRAATRSPVLLATTNLPHMRSASHSGRFPPRVDWKSGGLVTRGSCYQAGDRKPRTQAVLGWIKCDASSFSDEAGRIKCDTFDRSGAPQPEATRQGTSCWTRATSTAPSKPSSPGPLRSGPPSSRQSPTRSAPGRRRGRSPKF